jgi:hypothetical protein
MEGSTTPGRRWDTDERGHGVADATAATPAVERLFETMALDGWVAEEPEAHLLPHLAATASSIGLVLRTATAEDGAFEVVIDRDGQSQGELRAQTLTLVGSIAEASTHVRQVGDGEFEVVTGMLPGDSPVFATHGHLLRIRFV